MPIFQALRGLCARKVSRPCEECKDWHEQVYGELLGHYEKIKAENGRLVAEMALCNEAASQKDADSNANKALNAAEGTIHAKSIEVGRLSKKIDSLCTGHAKKDRTISTLRQKLDTVETKIERFKELARRYESQYESKREEIRALAIEMNDVRHSECIAVTDKNRAIEDKTRALRMRDRAHRESKEALRDRDQQRNELHDARRLIEELRTENSRLQSVADAAKKATSGLPTIELTGSKILSNSITSDDNSIRSPPLSPSAKEIRSPPAKITNLDNGDDAQDKTSGAPKAQDSVSNINVLSIPDHQKQQADWRCPVCNHSCGEQSATHRHATVDIRIPPQFSAQSSSNGSAGQANAGSYPKSSKRGKPKGRVSGRGKTSTAKDASPPSVLPTSAGTGKKNSLELPSAKDSAVRRKKRSTQVPSNKIHPSPSLNTPLQVPSKDQVVPMKQEATPSAATSSTDADVLRLEDLLSKLTLQGESGYKNPSAPATLTRPSPSLISPSTAISADSECSTKRCATATSSMEQTEKEPTFFSTTSAVREHTQPSELSTGFPAAALDVETSAPKHATALQGLQISEEESIAGVSSYNPALAHVDSSEKENSAVNASNLPAGDAGASHHVPSSQVLGYEVSETETQQSAAATDPNLPPAPGVVVTSQSTSTPDEAIPSQSISDRNAHDDLNDRMDTSDMHGVMGDSVIETEQSGGAQDHSCDGDDDFSTDQMDTRDMHRIPEDAAIEVARSGSTQVHPGDQYDDDSSNQMDTRDINKAPGHSMEGLEQAVGAQDGSCHEESDDASDLMDTSDINQPQNVKPAEPHTARSTERPNPSGSGFMRPPVFGGQGDLNEMDGVTTTSSKSGMIDGEAGLSDSMEEDQEDLLPSSSDALGTADSAADAMEDDLPASSSDALGTREPMGDAMEEDGDKPESSDSTPGIEQSTEDAMEESEDKPVSTESNPVPRQPLHHQNIPSVGSYLNGLDASFPKTDLHEAYTVVTGSSVGRPLPVVATTPATVSQRLPASFGQQPDSAQNSLRNTKVSPHMQQFLHQHAPLDQASKFAEGQISSLIPSKGPRLYDPLNQTANLQTQPSMAPATAPASATAITSITGPPLYDPLNRTRNVHAQPSIAPAPTSAPTPTVTSVSGPPLYDPLHRTSNVSAQHSTSPASTLATQAALPFIPGLNPYSLAALRSPIPKTPNTVPLSARGSFPPFISSSVPLPGSIASSSLAPTSTAPPAIDTSPPSSPEVPNHADSFLEESHDTIKNGSEKLDCVEPEGKNNTPEEVHLRQKREPRSLKSRAEASKISVASVPSPSHSPPTPTPTPFTTDTPVDVPIPNTSASSTAESPPSTLTETSSVQSYPIKQLQQKSSRKVSKWWSIGLRLDEMSRRKAEDRKRTKEEEEDEEEL